MKNIISVVGARPQFIKASVVDMEFKKRISIGININHEIIHTGQHFDSNMSKIFFEQLDLTEPKVYLDINNSTHGDMTGRMIQKLEKIMLEKATDLCVIYGDTNSTMAAALSAVKLGIPVAHVEAGMRRYDLSIPEDVNRRVSDHVSTLFFCSSETYAENLRKENLTNGIYVVGDVTYDSYKCFKNKAVLPDGVKHLRDYVVCTIHRQANTDDKERLVKVIESLRRVEKKAVMPLHPRTKNAMSSHGLNWPKNVILLDPVSYFEMLALLENCLFVITDSGGLQKDAAFSKKRCLTLLETTPWKELMELDINRPVDDNPDEICRNLSWAEKNVEDFVCPYGDGKASSQICDIITSYLT